MNVQKKLEEIRDYVKTVNPDDAKIYVGVESFLNAAITNISARKAFTEQREKFKKKVEANEEKNAVIAKRLKPTPPKNK